MAAGDWLSGAGLGDANISVAARAISAALHESQKNRALLGHPVIMDLMMRDQALGQLMGALGVSESFAAIAQGKLAATAEGTEATPTNFSTSNQTTVTPARRAFARDVGDFARSLQEGLLAGELSPSAEAMLAYEGLHLWFNDVVDRMVALASSATYEIGTTATALAWSPVNEGVYDLKDRGVISGSALGLLSAKGAKDLAADALSLGGAVQLSPDMQQFIASANDGAYIGRVNGVDWYLNSELDADGGDTLGILVTPGAFTMKHQRVPLPREADVLVDAGWYTMEMRRPGGGISRVETVSHNAIGIREQGRFAAIRYVS